MKLKACLVLMLFMLGENAFSYYVFDDNSVDCSKTKTSSIIRSTAYENSVNVESNAMLIDELENKVNANPQDYDSLVSLIDACINAKEYYKSVEILKQIYDNYNDEEASKLLSKKLETLKQKVAMIAKYTNNKSPLYINLAYIDLILGHNVHAEKFLRSAVPANSVQDRQLLIDAIRYIFDNTGNKEEAVAVCNLYLHWYKDDYEVRQIKFINLSDSNSVNAVIDEYKYFAANYPQNIQDDDNIIYRTYKALIAKNTFEKDIMKTLFGDNSNKEQNYYKLYDICKQRDDKSSAKIYADKIKKEFPNSIYAKFIQVEDLLNQGKKDEALDLLNNIKTLLTNQDEIRQYDSLLLDISEKPLDELAEIMNQGYYQKALDIIESGTIPESAFLLYSKATCCINLGQLQKAKEAIDKAAAINPNSYLANFMYASYYYEIKNYDVARSYYNKAAEFSPTDPRSSVLLDKINKAQVEKYVEQVYTNYENQNYNEALKLIELGLQVDPKSSELYFYQGLANIAKNDYAASTASFYKAIELDRTNALANYYLGLAFDNLSEPDNALTYYTKFVNMSSNSLGESDKVIQARQRIQKLKSKK